MPASGAAAGLRLGSMGGAALLAALAVLALGPAGASAAAAVQVRVAGGTFTDAGSASCR